MRLEELEKEAKMFDRDDECYIHVERAAGKQFTCLMSGDEPVIAQALYNLMSAFCNDYKKDFLSLLKLFKGIYRKVGPAKARE